LPSWWSPRASAPVEAVRLVVAEPQEYARIMHEAHLGIAAFGGSFLMMVGLTFFFDHEKDVHWVKFVESRMARFATIRGVEVAIVLILILNFAALVDPAKTNTFFHAAVYGLLAFLLIEVIAGMLDAAQEALSARNDRGRVPPSSADAPARRSIAP
jgi:hypothetical protein